MQDTLRHPVSRRALAEVLAFALLAGVTVGSAISAKHSAAGAPALTRLVDSAASETPLATIAARPTADREIGLVGGAGLAPGLDSAQPVEGAGGALGAAAMVDPEIRYFDGRPIRPVRTVPMTVTAYSPDAKSCGIWADGVTASNKSIWTNAMKLVAADTSVLPFGTLVSVPGYDHGNVAPVLDRGGAIKGDRLDVLYPTHEIALRWGVQRLPVTIWEYAD